MKRVWLTPETRRHSFLSFGHSRISFLRSDQNGSAPAKHHLLICVFKGTHRIATGRLCLCGSSTEPPSYKIQTIRSEQRRNMFRCKRLTKGFAQTPMQRNCNAAHCQLLSKRALYHGSVYNFKMGTKRRERALRPDFGLISEKGQVNARDAPAFISFVGPLPNFISAL